jgi:hypothetical protein
MPDYRIALFTFYHDDTVPSSTNYSVISSIYVYIECHPIDQRPRIISCSLAER